MDQEQDSRDTKTKERKRDNSTSSSDESRICSSSDNNNGQIQSFAKTNSKKASISSSRISANNHDDEPMNYEEENDSYCSNDEGRRNLPPHNNNFSPPPDKALYATTIPTTTSNSNNRSGAVETSDEINHQSGESCESSNDEKLLRQHDAEKRMEANRLRAKATRRKKKVMIEEMHSKIFELTAENEQLQNQNQNQHAEIEFLRNIQGGQHQQQNLPMQSLPPPMQNPMANRRNGASMMECNNASTNDAAPSAFSAAPSDSLPCSSNSIGNANAMSALPPYLGDMHNQLLRFGGDAQDLHHSIPEQNIASQQAMDLSNPSLAFLSNAGSRGVNASTSQIGLTGEQNDFPPHIFRPQGDQLLLQLLMEKHSNNTDV